jgi:hypothetical protein
MKIHVDGFHSLLFGFIYYRVGMLTLLYSTLEKILQDVHLSKVHNVFSLGCIVLFLVWNVISYLEFL